MEQRKPKEELMVALRSMRPQEHLWSIGQCLLGAYVLGEIRFGAPNLCGWSYKLCVGAATTVIIVASVGVGPTL